MIQTNDKGVDFVKKTMTNFLKFLAYQSPPPKEGFVLEENHTDTNTPSPPKAPPQYPTVSRRLEKNIKCIKDIYRLPDNSDITLKEFKIAYRDSDTRACVLFIDGMIDSAILNDNILMPLMIKSNILHTDKKTDLHDYVNSTLLTQNQTSSQTDFEKIISDVNFGSCAVFVDGLKPCFV